jgi:DHH family
LTAGVTPPGSAPSRPRRIPREWRLRDGGPPPEFEPRTSPLLRRVLWSRREVIDDVDAFLRPEDAALHSPAAMKSLPGAVELVATAIQERRRIAIFGDYDADGVTATALLQRGLTAAGAEVVTYIPHRIHDGYGLSQEGLEELDRQGAGLVITCDCGTNSVDVVEQRPAGQQVIITDHHLPAAEVARPDALLNPHQPGDEYPFKELSGSPSSSSRGSPSATRVGWTALRWSSSPSWWRWARSPTWWPSLTKTEALSGVAWSPWKSGLCPASGLSSRLAC